MQDVDPRVPAVAFCQGTPIRSEIEARPTVSLGSATHGAEAGLAKRFGMGPIDGAIRAHIVTVTCD